MIKQLELIQEVMADHYQKTGAAATDEESKQTNSVRRLMLSTNAMFFLDELSNHCDACIEKFMHNPFKCAYKDYHCLCFTCTGYIKKEDE